MKRQKKNIQTVAIATLGCKVNQCESASFQDGFEEHGLTVSSFGAPADIYVINTCAVTAKAAAQSRQLIRRAQRTNPQAKVVVTGCYAQVAPQKIHEIETGPIVIVGNANKHQVVEAALSGWKDQQAFPHHSCDDYFTDIGEQREISPLSVKRFASRTRAFLKVQDGCNNFCTYCIVPYARGRSRSLPLDMAVSQAHRYAEAGHREIVLTGIHVGHYGLDLRPANRLLGLLQELTAATPAIRYRLSSLEPSEINEELLSFMLATGNFMDHLHIPLQSGSDSILKKMHRRYTADEFAETVTRCKEKIPAAAIGVDVLVGFPGETERDFLQTYELVERLPVSYLHVFPYSKRPGTPAAKMARQVPQKIKEERVAVLRKLDHKKRTGFYGSRLGLVHPVLVESEKSANGLAKGFTDNYIPVHFEAKQENINRVVLVKLERVQDRFVIGTLA